GGRLGSGLQWMSWIALDDVLGVTLHALRGSLAGPVNTTSPHPVTNAEFTRVLARVLGRPAIFPMPAFAARLPFAQTAPQLLLARPRLVPARLEPSNYRFPSPEREGALRPLLARSPS